MMESGDSDLPTSQIPGLSDTGLLEDEPIRRSNIRDTDSEYIRLAKQGGTEGLLAFQEIEKNENAVDYPKSDWFGHHSMEREEHDKILSQKQWKAPDYMTYDNSVQKREVKLPVPLDEKPRTLTAREERLLIQAKYNNREVPYQSDNLTYWERKDEPPKRNRFHK